MRKQHIEVYLALLVKVLGLHQDQKERRKWSSHGQMWLGEKTQGAKVTKPK
jgi:hypothetical protein